MKFDTLESAQAEIVRLNEELTKTTTERDAARNESNSLKEQNENLHALNQSYFNKLSQQFLPDQDDDEDDPEPLLSCEEFAKTLSI